MNLASESMGPPAVFFVIIVEQLCRHLGVRLRIELIIALDELFFQFLIIFYDSVMDGDHRFIVAAMGMRVFRRRFPVRRPAGVSDAAAAFERQAVIGLFREHLQPSLRLDDLHVRRPVAHGKSRGVIPAVFEF